MEKLKDLETDLQYLHTEVLKYNTTPTKAASKRIRIALGELKKQITEIRTILRDADKQK